MLHQGAGGPGATGISDDVMKRRTGPCCKYYSLHGDGLAPRCGSTVVGEGDQARASAPGSVCGLPLAIIKLERGCCVGWEPTAPAGTGQHMPGTPNARRLQQWPQGQPKHRGARSHAMRLPLAGCQSQAPQPVLAAWRQAQRTGTHGAHRPFPSVAPDISSLNPTQICLRLRQRQALSSRLAGILLLS